MTFSRTATIFIFFLLLVQPLCWSQNFQISGFIKSKEGTLPFATVLVKGTNNGCTANAEGYYRLQLKSGSYEIEFHYLGCEKKTIKITLDKNIQINVVLETEGVRLKEIEVNAGEDPSYPIIRKAIEKRSYYLNQIEAYSCRTYIKGMQKIVALPKNFDKLLKMMGGHVEDTNQLKGIVYLSESESRFYFKQPRQIHEEMFSSKVSGNSQAFSFNKLSDMALNFNENFIEMPGLSDRPLVSPIHHNAFFWYRYYLIDSDTSENTVTYKIKVVPKRANDPCFKGVIYIQDKSYRITGVDVRLNRANKINFVDTLYIKQVYAATVMDTVWMPVNLNLSFDFKVFGVKGYGFFNAFVKDYDFNPGEQNKNKQNEILKIGKEASDKDSAYWRLNRPMALTSEEENDYRTKDSVRKITESKRYKDSIDWRDNKPQWGNLLSGYSYRNSAKGFSIKIPGIMNSAIQYNTVEGVHVSYQMDIDKTYEDKRKKEMTAKVRYGFANQLWGGEWSGRYYFNPEKNARIGFTVKSIVEQYNLNNPISPLVNTVYTLFLNENWMKLYKETGVECNYFSEIINGLYGRFKINYAKRDQLRNHTDMLLVDNPKKLFSDNLPFKGLARDSMNPSNNAFITELSFLIRFKQKYYTLPNQKVVIGTKYPKLNITYKKAIALHAGDANFDLLGLTLNDDIKIGLLGKLAYRINAGQYLRHTTMYFNDFKHFMGNQTVINGNDYLGSFRLLPYYTYSADLWYLEAHAEHHFRGLFLTKLPLLKKLAWQEVAGVHYLRNNRLTQNYVEINVGLEHVFKMLRVDYVLAYAGKMQLKSGITFGLSVSL